MPYVSSLQRYLGAENVINGVISLMSSQARLLDSLPSGQNKLR